MKNEEAIRQAIVRLEEIKKDNNKGFVNQAARNNIAFCDAKIAALKWVLDDKSTWV